MARVRRAKETQDTISNVLEMFIIDKESQGRAQKTIKDYEESIKKFIAYNGDMPINELELSNVMAYRNHMKKEEELKIGSINHYLRDLRTFLNYAYDTGYLLKQIKVSLMSGQEEIKDVYTEEELEVLLRKPTNLNDFVEYRTYVIVCYILATGNRAETVCSLTLGDVDLSRRIVRIPTAKNKKVSSIAIDKQITAILRKYINEYRSDCTPEEYLFCNIGGDKLTARALGQAFRKYSLERGLKKTSVHLLRHTFSKMYIMNGGSEFKLQNMLGHSSLSMTRHYVAMFGTDLARDIDNVSPLVSMTRNSGGIEKRVRRRE